MINRSGMNRIIGIYRIFWNKILKVERVERVERVEKVERV